ncbi:hypothetical protein FACS1894202_14120 [Clostridia bacterium]|nr:hypothetical protein FACS1894202_14120 [Clostridia bacterium]
MGERKRVTLAILICWLGPMLLIWAVMSFISIRYANAVLIGLAVIVALVPLPLYLISYADKRLRVSYQHTYDSKLKLRDAQIEMLQAQINPHFVNNTLELVNWQSRINGDETTSHMVEALGTLVSAAVVRDECPFVQLYEEMEYVDAYLYITSIRFKNRLVMYKEIDQTLMGEELPKMSIQPLLENAIAYGVKFSPVGKVRVLLRIYERVGHLYIEVTNSGALSEQGRAEVDKTLSTYRGKIDKSGQRRIGLANICQRLALLYGEKARLSYISTEDSTTFMIAIKLV